MSLLPSQAPLAHFPAGQHTSSPRSIPPSPPSSVVAMPLQTTTKSKLSAHEQSILEAALRGFPRRQGPADSTDSRPIAPPRAPLGPGSVSLVDDATDAVNPLPTQPRREVEIVHRVPPISNRFRPYQPPQHLVALSTKSPYAPQAQFIQQPPSTHTMRQNQHAPNVVPSESASKSFQQNQPSLLSHSIGHGSSFYTPPVSPPIPQNRQIPQNHEFQSQPQPVQAPPVQYRLQYSQPVSLIAPQPQQTHLQSEPNQGLHQTPHHIQQPIYRPIAPQQTPIPPTQPVPQTILPEQVPPSNKPLSKTIPFRILPNGQKTYPCPRDDCTKEFGTPWQCISHIKHHENVRKHQCDQCPLAFVRKHDLGRHQKSVHEVAAGQPLFACGSCGHGFGRVDSLRRHVNICREKGQFGQ